MHHVKTAFKLLLTMIVLTGLIYPLLITFIAQLTMAGKAGGSLIIDNNQVRGSSLIAQNFKGNAYFWPRPSAIDFNPIKPSGGSNLGPTSQKLKQKVEERLKIIGSKAPAELVYASGSGLDPHISVKTAHYQLNRIAEARSIANRVQLHSLIDSLAEGFRKEYINVLLLNITLDQQFPFKKNNE